MSDADISIRLEFTYVYEDFFPSRSLRGLFTWRKILMWVVVLGLGVVGFWFFSRPPEVEGEGVRQMNSFPWIFTVFLAFMVFKQFHRMSRKKWAATYPQQRWVITFSRLGIVIELPTQRMEMQWTTYKRFEERDGWFILHSVDNQSLPLPMRVIPEERVDDLRRLIEEQLSYSGGFPVEVNRDDG